MPDLALSARSDGLPPPAQQPSIEGRQARIATAEKAEP